MITNFLFSILGFIVAVGLLTTVHEFGHFWAAKRLGIKVLRFSVGFGKPLICWQDSWGTEYVIAALPLGGYVKILDESEGVVPGNERHLAFNNRPVWVRMVVILAGPLFNMLFAVCAYWLVFVIGISAVIPILGSIPKGSIADLAGLKRGMEVVQINDTPIQTWEDVSVAVMPYVGEKGAITFHMRVQNQNTITEHVADLSHWTVENEQGDVLSSLGLEPYDPVPPIVGKLMPGLPAEKAGFREGDHIETVDGEPIHTRTELTRYLRTKGLQTVHIKVQRDGHSLTLPVVPIKKLQEGGEEVGFIGIQYEQMPYPPELVRRIHHGPGSALTQALKRTYEYTILTFQFLHKMITGKVSLQNLAGPISIAKYAGQTARIGVEYFLGFLALVSISLGVLNMLPIPILDGGQFLFCLYEWVHGAPLSDRALHTARLFGILFLASLMLLALYNDIMRL